MLSFSKLFSRKKLVVASVLSSALVFSVNTYADDDHFPEEQTQMAQDDVSDIDYEKAIDLFMKAPESAAFFDSSYGYAVFPTIGKVGVIIGGAYGKGRVFEKGRYAGYAELTQATIGFQFGGQAYSQIIFLQDQRSFDEFTAGNFEFGAQASAIAITAGAYAEASTKGTSASANLGERNIEARGQYYKGMAVFSAAKAGLMYEATLGGQKFNFYPN